MARARPNPEQLIAAVPMSEALRALARRAEARHYRRGTVLAEEGDTGDTLFVIIDGHVRAFGRHAGSEREITYGIYGAGEYVGEMSLDGGLRSASQAELSAETTRQCGRRASTRSGSPRTTRRSSASRPPAAAARP